MERKLRWGIIGCANIALKSTIPGIQQSETGVVTAISSRDQDKAQKAADDLGIEKAYGSYEELLSDDEIDAVYIPLPNHLHKDWTIRAAQAGKHVLCEKPIALTSDEAVEMVQACQEAGVKLAEAFMYRHHPRYSMIKEILRSGEIGEIRGIHGTFTFNASNNHGNVRFTKAWGGGSLYDIGCYPLSAARYLLEAEPEAATVQAFFSPEHDNVDMMASGLVEFPGNIGLTFDCAMWAGSRNTLEILGSEGRLEMAPAFVGSPVMSANFKVFNAAGEREVEAPRLNQYALQADDFARSLWGETALSFVSEDAVANMRVLEACLKSAEERCRVAL